MGAQLAAPVAALHAAAFGLGYVLCKLLNFDEKTARTVSIETGALPHAVLHVDLVPKSLCFLPYVTFAEGKC